ncbi:MAG: DUF6653 family protein [Paracoccaceae bacterium]
MTGQKWDIFRLSERMMHMDEATWARHANPWSVYTRFSILPLMTVAVWSRNWLGWGALVPVAVVVIWTWLNPRLFGPPETTDHWAAHGTFGERVFLNRHVVPIPTHHRLWGVWLSVVAGLGIVPWVYGLWAYDLSATLLGLTLMIGAKLWFVDRMVWLYQDMRDADPTYAAWSR